MATSEKAIPINPARSRHRLYRIIRSLPEGDYLVNLNRQRRKASSSQRGYYWGYLVVEVGRFLQLDRDAADKVLCGLFLSEEWVIGDEAVRIVRSTSDLTPEQTESFYAQIRSYAWNTWRLNLDLPGGVPW